MLKYLRKATLTIEGGDLPSIQLQASESLVESVLAVWLESVVADPSPEGAGAADTERAEDHSEPELKIGFQRNPVDDDE